MPDRSNASWAFRKFSVNFFDQIEDMVEHENCQNNSSYSFELCETRVKFVAFQQNQICIKCGTNVNSEIILYRGESFTSNTSSWTLLFCPDWSSGWNLNVFCVSRNARMFEATTVWELLVISKKAKMTVDANSFVTENSTYHSALSNATESYMTERQQTWGKTEEIARILNVVIRPVLIVFGTIGNGLSCYIMRQGLLKKMSTCFFLSILALADTSKWRCFCSIK